MIQIAGVGSRHFVRRVFLALHFEEPPSHAHSHSESWTQWRSRSILIHQLQGTSGQTCAPAGAKTMSLEGCHHSSWPAASRVFSAFAWHFLSEVMTPRNPLSPSRPDGQSPQTPSKPESPRGRTRSRWSLCAPSAGPVKAPRLQTAAEQLSHRL